MWLGAFFNPCANCVNCRGPRLSALTTRIHATGWSLVCFDRYARWMPRVLSCRLIARSVDGQRQFNRPLFRLACYTGLCARLTERVKLRSM